MFIVEVGGHVLNYLDLPVSLEPDDIDDGCLVLKCNDQSLHPTPHKLAVIQVAVSRLLRLPLSPEAQNQEIRVLERIAEVNNLSVNVKLLNKTETPAPAPIRLQIISWIC